MIKSANERISPSKVATKKGKSIDFKCHVQFSSTLHWFFNHGPLPDNVKQDGNSISINKTKEINIGIYECIGKADNKPYYSLFSATASLNFKSKSP